MNKSKEFNEDILSRYISPDMIEKAPEGFTQRMMTRLQSEEVTSLVMKRSEKKSKVPLFSAAITIVLISAAIVLSPSGNNYPELTVIKALAKIHFPVISVNKIFYFTLPQLLIYISLGIFLLLLFDQLLNRLFNKERKQ